MTSWFFPELIKKKVCRYLLHRYLGTFIDEKIDLSQLDVNFYNGTGTLKDVILSPQVRILKTKQNLLCHICHSYIVIIVSTFCYCVYSIACVYIHHASVEVLHR